MVTLVTNFRNYGGKMKVNKKLVKHSIIFQGIGVLIFSILVFLNYFSLIDLENRWLNGAIYVASAILCASYYGFIYYKYLLRNCLEECIILGIITVPISVVEIFIALSVAGIHTGIVAIWGGAMMSITVHCIISYLEVLEEDLFVTDKKYIYLIQRLKLWINPTFVGLFIVGIVIVFFPDGLVVF